MEHVVNKYLYKKEKKPHTHTHTTHTHTHTYIYIHTYIYTYTGAQWSRGAGGRGVIMRPPQEEKLEENKILWKNIFRD